MSGAALIACCLTVPLAAAVAILAGARRPRWCEACALIAPPLLALAVVALASLEAAPGAAPHWIVAEPIEGLSLAFRAEPLGLLFALVASLLWIPTSWYCIGYARGHALRHRPRFYACFALALASTQAIALSANLLTLFVFYELLTLSTYPLVAHAGDDRARRAGRIYLAYLLGTSLGLQLPAILWTWQLAGTLEFAAGGILDEPPAALWLLFVFGVGKAALMPVHRWLPAAMVAPTPVSALLHAVAVVKSGAFAILKIGLLIFGPETMAAMATADWAVYIAAATIVLASVAALRSDNLKERLAYSTVAQLAYIVLGAALAGDAAIRGAGAHIATHACGKITLFFCAGTILLASGYSRVSELNGLGRRMPLAMTAFFIGSLSVIGLPPAAGLWSKWWLLQGAVQAEHYVALAALAASSLLSVYYLLAIPARAFFLPPAQDASDRGGREPAACKLALAVTAAACIVLFFVPWGFAGFVHRLPLG